ncbi:MAG: CBS domain-containing protein [Burkholderiaceae bacterium]|nr:CBS domain-containing protein [Burkholderiaceae bacterium]
MEIPISALMTKLIWAVNSEDTIDKVDRFLTLHKLSAAPVVDQAGALFGIISSHDLLHFFSTKRNPRAVRAWELCTYRPTSVGPDTPVSAVAGKMLENKIHHLLIVEDGKLIGIVSALDFVRQCIPELAKGGEIEHQELVTPRYPTDYEIW